MPSSSTSSGEEDEEGPWCYCQQDLEGSTLIGGDNDSCKIKWYHMSCLKLKDEPETGSVQLVIDKPDWAITIKMSNLFNCTINTKIIWAAPSIVKMQTEICGCF